MAKLSEILAAVILTASHAVCVGSYPTEREGVGEAARELLKVLAVAPTDMARLEETFRVSILIVQEARELTTTEVRANVGT
jgi:hypothetical protein